AFIPCLDAMQCGGEPIRQLRPAASLLHRCLNRFGPYEVGISQTSTDGAQSYRRCRICRKADFAGRLSQNYFFLPRSLERPVLLRISVPLFRSAAALPFIRPFTSAVMTG